MDSDTVSPAYTVEPSPTSNEVTRKLGKPATSNDALKLAPWESPGAAHSNQISCVPAVSPPMV